MRSLGGLAMFGCRFFVAVIAVVGWLFVAPTAATAAPTNLYVATDGSDTQCMHDQG